MRSIRFFRGAGRGAVMAVLAVLALGAFAASASAAEGEGFGLNKFESGTCTENGPETAAEVEAEGKTEEEAAEEECTYGTRSKFYTQADGHPKYGITDFEVNTKPNVIGEKEPEGVLRTIRNDLPLGLSVNGQVTETKCNKTLLAANECPESSKLGTNEAVVYVPAAVEYAPGLFAGADVPLTGTAYNLEPPSGVPLEVGIEFYEPALGINSQSYLVGGVSSHEGETYPNGEPVAESGNYHEYFTIYEASGAENETPLISSRLIFEGAAMGTGYLTLPSMCGSTVSTLHLESAEEAHFFKPTEPPAPVSGCENVPFKPAVKVTPSTTQADAPDGATVEVSVPQNTTAAELSSSSVKEATVTLPEGMTFNPSVANGLEVCTNEEFGKKSAKKVTCPAGSEIGTATIETPTLPAGSLIGKVYVGTPESTSPISGKEYRIFIATETERYGVAVRLEGEVKANETTGQLSTLVAENPPIPFTKFILQLNNASHTPLANPITCATASAASTFVSYSEPASVGGLLTEPFAVTGCAAFAPTQSTSESSTQGGAATSFAFTLTRPEGQPYVSTLSTTLPPGLVGKIPSVPRCEEAQASKAECPAASSIGTVAVKVGSGATPYELGGSVYLTGPYDGAPYGLDIVTNAEKVGPYDYGLINTRAKIEVNPSTAQVTVASNLPTVVGGAPIRLRSLTVTVDHANFMINPTNCEALSTTTALTSTLGTSSTASSPFQVTGCSSLGFKPTFKAASSAKKSKKGGASFETTLTMPAGDANVKSVSVTLPKKLPSRDSTLNHACLLATFEANPESCKESESEVGTASVVTPALPGKLEGTAYYVSLGHAGFPNLDIVLKGDGVTIVLIGKTNIKGGITHTNFLTLPDVPVTSFALKLPTGKNSALSGEGSFCKKALYLPTTIVGQNGAKFTQKTKIGIADCPVVLIKHKVKRRKVAITVKTPSAGKIVTSGTDLVRKTKKVSKAKVATITEMLSKAGARKLAKKHKLKLAVHVKFTPTKGKASKASFKVKVKK